MSETTVTASTTPPTSSPPTSSANLLNVPNVATIARIVLSLVLFLFLSLGWYATSLVLFVITAFTDWFDGYWARKYGQITQLGRVLDPFADKLFICGVFIFLAATAPLVNGTQPSGITAWMAVVIVGRELLVTTLRTFVEQRGGDFSAKWIGKWKMVLQCLAAGWSIVHLSYLNAAGTEWQIAPPAWMSKGLPLVAWATVLVTLYSGYTYVQAAIEMMRPAKPTQ